MNADMIPDALESILYMAGDAVEISAIAAAFEVDISYLSDVVNKIIQSKQEKNAGLLISRMDDKLQLCTNPAYAPFIESVLAPVKKSRLSQSLLETLAIIAYRQPVTRFEIDQIRGVKSSYSVAMLIEKGLILRAGRKKTLGNPMLYVTSDEFLRHFGLGTLKELPELNTAEMNIAEQ